MIKEKISNINLKDKYNKSYLIKTADSLYVRKLYIIVPVNEPVFRLSSKSIFFVLRKKSRSRTKRNKL